jgi:predicted nucleic acid-binding protein
MVLADSCLWIEWLTDGPNAPLCEDIVEGDVAVVPIVLAEVTRWFLRERGRDDLVRVQGLLMKRPVVPMTSAVGNLAGELGVIHGLAMADAIIYAHAQMLRVDLATQDEHFRGLPGVRWFESEKKRARR